MIVNNLFNFFFNPVLTYLIGFNRHIYVCVCVTPVVPTQSPLQSCYVTYITYYNINLNYIMLYLFNTYILLADSYFILMYVAHAFTLSNMTCLNT